MAHYNDSWDLPPLVGSCYMYGPRTEGYTEEQVKEIFTNLRAELLLDSITTDLMAVQLPFLEDSSTESQVTAALLQTSLDCVTRVARMVQAKIPVTVR